MINENNPKVCIIDYGVGNVTSVKNVLNFIGFEPFVSADPKILERSDFLILPGVGSFEDGMNNLKKKGLVEILKKEVLENKKPILGICLGMQLFATKGHEYGEHEGLDFIKGEVLKIDNSKNGLRLPQIGWNDVNLSKKCKLAKNFEKDPIFYFVHSYYFKPEDDEVIAGTCDYGEKITAMIESQNIYGTQFHPEKSHTDGIRIIKNFLNLDSNA